MEERFENITLGFLCCLLIIVTVITIAQMIQPTKRQSYKVYKENDLTVVERVEE